MNNIDEREDNVMIPRRRNTAAAMLTVLTASVLTFTGASSAQAAVVTCYGVPVTKLGTETKDQLHGTPERDVIHALGGDDTIDGLGGDDILCGGAGNDRIAGHIGDDHLYGGDGNDTLDGHEGRDDVHGDARFCKILPSNRCHGAVSATTAPIRSFMVLSLAIGS